MKKLMLVVTMLLMATQTRAETLKLTEVLGNLPNLNGGIGYSIKDNAPVYLGTIDLATYKGFNLEGGYAGRNKESLDEVIGALTYTLVDRGSLNFPILKYFSARAGYYLGLGHINLQDISGAKLDHGPALTGIISVKF